MNVRPNVTRTIPFFRDGCVLKKLLIDSFVFIRVSDNGLCAILDSFTNKTKF